MSNDKKNWIFRTCFNRFRFFISTWYTGGVFHLVHNERLMNDE